MLTKDFHYDLPEQLIAQQPTYPRDNSKLLVLDKKTSSIKNDYFYNIGNYLKKGDLLVLNDTRVIPARLFGKTFKHNSSIEILLLKQTKNNSWEILCKPGKKAKLGSSIKFSDNLSGEIVDILEDGQRIINFSYKGNFFDIVSNIGFMPLPPYIKEKLNDKERYQTVYSKELGSAAAPTAGLHFTKELLQNLELNGINLATVTLHVGLGTFRPVKVDKIENHKMHSEYFEIKQKTIELINKTKERGNKVIAVGTTSLRTLEGAYSLWGELKSSPATTDIFIYPGYKFNIVDQLLTNFHLPQSTLVMLVSAFAGYENTMKAYNYAVKEEYKFFSFGDAMFIK